MKITDYKVGDTLIIVGNKGTHHFNIGEKVEITETYFNEKVPYFRSDGKDDYWYIYDAEDVKLVSRKYKQIRDELEDLIKILENQVKNETKQETKDFPYPCVVRSIKNGVIIFAEESITSTTFSGTQISNHNDEKGKCINNWAKSCFELVEL